MPESWRGSLDFGMDNTRMVFFICMPILDIYCYYWYVLSMQAYGLLLITTTTLSTLKIHIQMVMSVSFSMPSVGKKTQLPRPIQDIYL